MPANGVKPICLLGRMGLESIVLLTARKPLRMSEACSGGRLVLIVGPGCTGAKMFCPKDKLGVAGAVMVGEVII